MESIIAQYVGKVVLLRVSQQFIDMASCFIQANNKSAQLLYARLEAVDHLGAWVENRLWKTADQATGEISEYKVFFLVPWQYIVSVALFPEREFSNDLLPEEHGIGFLADIK